MRGFKTQLNRWIYLQPYSVAHFSTHGVGPHGVGQHRLAQPPNSVNGNTTTKATATTFITFFITRLPFLV